MYLLVLNHIQLKIILLPSGLFGGAPLLPYSLPRTTATEQYSKSLKRLHGSSDKLLENKNRLS